jgi:hypothetical protein
MQKQTIIRDNIKIWLENKYPMAQIVESCSSSNIIYIYMPGIERQSYLHNKIWHCFLHNNIELSPPIDLLG